jgi:hypothetical protein
MGVGSSRRTFLAAGVSLAGIGWVSLQGRALAAMSPVRRLTMRRSAFLPLLGQKFRIAHGEGSLSVVLSQVSDLRPSASPGAEDQFSLMFTDARLRPIVDQGTYHLSHARLGRIRLLIVPVGPRVSVQNYQVIVDNQPLSTFRDRGNIRHSRS